MKIMKLNTNNRNNKSTVNLSLPSMKLGNIDIEKYKHHQTQPNNQISTGIITVRSIADYEIKKKNKKKHEALI